MANYNKVILVGNLTRDPQMSYLPSQTPVNAAHLDRGEPGRAGPVGDICLPLAGPVGGFLSVGRMSRRSPERDDGRAVDCRTGYATQDREGG